MINAAVLGSPISHSLSPRLHMSAYKHLNISGNYGSFDVPAGSLRDFLTDKASGWTGFSLTMPLKEEVLSVAEVIEENSGTALRSRVGHSYIKAMMAQSGAIFGGEHSGHFYFKDFWKADSGALAALHAIAALGSSKVSLSKLLKPYQRYFSSGEINSKVKDAQHSMSVIEKQYADLDSVTIDHLDGLTVNGDTWWFNLRPSNTEPLLRLNVEAKDLARMEKIKKEVLATVRK